MGLIDSLRRPTGFRQTLAAIFLLVGSVLTVGTALLFEHVGGYLPCALCLQERHPYYFSIVVGIAAVIAAGRARPLLTRGLILLIGIAMLYGLSLGIYHAGVEWHFWAGPTDCAQVSVDLSGDLLAAIDAIQPPACDEAAGRFLGLSFAGWNVVASALFAAVALYGAFARADRFA